MQQPAQPRRRRRIVVDPAHGGPDRGVVAGGVAEADLMWDLARRIAGRMIATGIDVLLTRSEHACPTVRERAAFANDADADLVLSLHTDADHSLHAEGLATFHPATGRGAEPTVAETLAGLLQRELLARTAMRDCRTHGWTWGLAQHSRMPTVRVELGYLTHLGDRRRLLDPAFRDVVADGVLVAVQRLHLPGADDQPTGTFTCADLLAYEREHRGAQSA